MTHELKTHPQAFEGLLSQLKTFEYRHNDRDFQVGDTLILLEYKELLGEYTGRYLKAKVTYILRGPSFHIPKDYCIMSISIDSTTINAIIPAMPEGERLSDRSQKLGDYNPKNTYKGGYTQKIF